MDEARLLAAALLMPGVVGGVLAAQGDSSHRCLPPSCISLDRFRSIIFARWTFFSFSSASRSPTELILFSNATLVVEPRRFMEAREADLRTSSASDKGDWVCTKKVPFWPFCWPAISEENYNGRES